MTTLNAYNGRKIVAPTRVKDTLVHLLRILAGRERDHSKINLRTFQANELKPRGLKISFREVQEAFQALAEAGICKLDTGSEGRLERAQFKESARHVAQKILGVHKILATEQFVLGAGRAEPGPDLEAAREILRADMPDATKVRVLKTLLLKE